MDPDWQEDGPAQWQSVDLTHVCYADERTAMTVHHHISKVKEFLRILHIIHTLRGFE